MKSSSKCPICNGEKEFSTTTFTVDLGTNLIVVRNTPATVCSVCGEEWIDDTVAEQLEEIVNEAKAKNRMVEVIDFNLESTAYNLHSSSLKLQEELHFDEK